MRTATPARLEGPVRAVALVFAEQLHSSAKTRHNSGGNP